MVRSIAAAVLVTMCAGSTLAKAPSHRWSTPILTRPPAFELSRFYVGAKEGVVWSPRRDAFSHQARFATDLGPGAFVAEPVSPHYAGLSRGIVVVPDFTSTSEDTSDEQINPFDERKFGDLKPATSGIAASPALELEKGLIKIGADQFTHNDLPSDHFVRNSSTGSEITPSGFAVAHGEISSNPGATRNKRPTAFDASEGTLLDPLLNTTYDLNFSKTVPNLK
jgi:hypothetical protein